MIIITGNPGTGKHTIAKIIAKNNGMELVDISKVAISSGIAVKNNGVLEVDVKKLKKVLDKKITKKTLLVGHLAPYVVSKGNVGLAIVLRRSPYKLERVYKMRCYSKAKATENLGAEILGITYFDTIKKIGKKKTFQFDTTNSSITTTAKSIQHLLASGKAKADDVDWLKTVSQRGDLKRFFPY